MSEPHHERIEELLAQHVVEGLSPAERAELEQLLGADTARELDAWEQAAALCDLAVRPVPDVGGALSGELRSRLEARGRALLGAGPPDAADAGPAGGGAAPLPGPGSARLAWLAAAAAGLLALLGWWPRLAPDGPPSAAERMAQLEQQAPDLVRAEWAALEDPRLAGMGGEVVWSDALQAGFMRLRNVPVNDPREAQYQLWIVDPDRDAEPVDGGVFDVIDAGEVVVPIRAKLAVRTPEVFALTLEQPGGVVVSEGPLLAAAAVES